MKKRASYTYKFKFLLIEKINQDEEMEIDVNFWKQDRRLCCARPNTWTFISIHRLQQIHSNS